MSSSYAYTIHYMPSHRLAKRGMFDYESAKTIAENISIWSERNVILKRHTPSWYNDCNCWTDDYWIKGVHCSEFRDVCDTCKRALPDMNNTTQLRDVRYCKCWMCDLGL